MLSARSPLSVKNQQTLSSQIDSMSLDKENTVRAGKKQHVRPDLLEHLSFKIFFLILFNIFVLFQPPSLNSTRVLASKTARKIFSEAAVSLWKCSGERSEYEPEYSAG